MTLSISGRSKYLAGKTMIIQERKTKRRKKIKMDIILALAFLIQADGIKKRLQYKIFDVKTDSIPYIVLYCIHLHFI